MKTFLIHFLLIPIYILIFIIIPPISIIILILISKDKKEFEILDIFKNLFYGNELEFEIEDDEFNEYKNDRSSEICCCNIEDFIKYFFRPELIAIYFSVLFYFLFCIPSILFSLCNFFFFNSSQVMWIRYLRK
jgi:hypothetical protein